MDHGISTFRLYLLRAVYLLIAVGLGVEVWPALLGPTGAPGGCRRRTASSSFVGIRVPSRAGLTCRASCRVPSRQR